MFEQHLLQMAIHIKIFFIYYKIIFHFNELLQVIHFKPGYLSKIILTKLCLVVRAIN